MVIKVELNGNSDLLNIVGGGRSVAVSYRLICHMCNICIDSVISFMTYSFAK